jgi:hypothetical protein
MINFHDDFGVTLPILYLLCLLNEVTSYSLFLLQLGNIYNTIKVLIPFKT